ncbi:UNVERIFIED_CONTAM: protein LURP-one-related 8 [Sesamum calycinum]|uniref:Protein LURP-one-related 8 n=1 Tax=Sesamum calycinum TaxID=2727403 RepID=A0AAW2RQL3_9LAMI
MTKVYPNASPLPKPSGGCTKAAADDSSSRVLTVWRKSLLFNCDGFTVFDADGNLVYRVDNYMSGNKGEIFLMDASGTSLLTIRRKKLSLTDSWLVYDGETADNPRFVVTKNVVNLLKSKRLLAQVTSPRKNTEVYEIEGSYSQRCCAVYDEKRRRVAEIKQKEASVKGVAFGTDIFRLVVQPGFDATLAMAIVILLDQMFGSSTSTRRRLLTN